MIAVPASPKPAARVLADGRAAALSPLAVAIQKVLVRRLRSRSPTLTYGELVEALAPKHPTHRRSSALHAALNEVSTACRARGVPCLPAIVHRADSGRPGPAYYRAAHPRVRSDAARIAAWEAELVAVLAASERYG